MVESEPVKLSILICTIPKRAHFLARLMDILQPQIKGCEDVIEIIIDDHHGDTIGKKRNRLLQKARGQYVAFIDDDDRVSDTYVLRLLEGIETGADCCSLIGVITEDGAKPRKFYHSIKYDRYETITDPTGYADILYLRYPNHLNCIKSTIAKQFGFIEIGRRAMHGEDTNWAMQVHHSGQLMTEHEINEIIYYYDYITDK